MEDLIGKDITLFLDGGWKLFGRIKDMHKSMIVIETEDRECVVFKEKVAYMIIGQNLANEPKIVKNKQISQEREIIPYDHQGFSLPSDLLSNDYHDEDNDFSVNFGSSSSDKKMSFSVRGNDNE